MSAGITRLNTYANGKDLEKSNGDKIGAGDLPAPKILIEKVLTNVSGCDRIKVQKTKEKEMEETEMEKAMVIELMELYCDGAYSDYKRLQKENGDFDVATNAAFYRWMGAIEMAQEVCEQLDNI